jgi:hypothetical protein
MKIAKAFLGVVIFYLLFFLGGTSFSGCKKTEIIHDTTIRVVHDTTIHNIHDTTTRVDTIYDVKDGLVAYYNFNGGNLNDSSGFNNHIVFNNATKTADRFGNSNNAYLFDGSSNYMRVSNSPSLNPDNITLFAIIKINGYNNSLCHANQILGKGYPDYVNGFYNLRFNDYSTSCVSAPNINNEIFSGEYGDDNPQGADAGVGSDTVFAKPGQWYYVVFTYDGITAKLYINGQLKNAVQKSVPFTDNSYNLFIGRHEDPPYPYYFNGIIDEIRIYNRALPAGAIRQLSK